MGTETVLLILIVLAGAYMAWNIGANDVANAMDIINRLQPKYYEFRNDGNECWLAYITL